MARFLAASARTRSSVPGCASACRAKRRALRLVSFEAGQLREKHECFCATATRARRRQRLFEQFARSARIACEEAVAGGGDRPAVGVVGVVDRRQPAGLLAQLRGRRGRASRAGVLRRLLEGMRDAGVRSVRREREMASALVRVRDELGKAPVELAAPDRIDALVRRRGEQRVRKTDAVALELDDVRVERGAKGFPSVGDRSGEELERRLRERRGRSEDVATLRRQQFEPGTNELLEAVGNR